MTLSLELTIVAISGSKVPLRFLDCTPHAHSLSSSSDAQMRMRIYHYAALQSASQHGIISRAVFEQLTVQAVLGLHMFWPAHMP